VIGRSGHRVNTRGRQSPDDPITRSPDYVTLTSVYVPYTCFSASQISPTVA
jgi:hypothetical protein